MSVRKFDPEYWASFLPELPGHEIVTEYGETVQIETAADSTVPVVINQAKYFQFRVNNLDEVQEKQPELVQAIMQHVYRAMLDAAGNASVICLRELEAYHSKREKADFVKGLFFYGGQERAKSDEN